MAAEGRTADTDVKAPWLARPRTRSAQGGLTLRDFGLSTLALLVLGAISYAPVRHGGFYLDDWSNAAGALYPPGGENAFSYFREFTIYRPVLVLYLPLQFFVLGTHMAVQLAWSAFLAVSASALLYGVLRKLGVPRLHAWFPPALALIYPWYDSTRLWVTGGLLTLSICFTFAGLWLALEGLERRSWRLHACAATLYLASIWTYEVTLPLIALAGAVYTVRAGWRAARFRWAIDLLVVLVGGVWIATQTTQESEGFSTDLKHVGEIIVSGGTIIGRSLLPLGQPRTTLALLILLVVILCGLAVLVARRGPTPAGASWSLRGWLLLTGGGLLVAALGWIMFIPANPYFTPSVYGITNRVNAFSGFGIVILLYGVFGVIGELLARAVPQVPRLALAVTVLLALVLGGVYVHVFERHVRIWNAAFHAEMAGLGEMRMQFPQLPPGTTVFTSDYPAYQALGVPIFSASWDVNGMIKLQYKSGVLAAYPVLEGLRLICKADVVWLGGAGAPTAIAKYGSVRFLNVHTGEHAAPPNRKQCEAVAGKYTPGAPYVSVEY
jgi:hypothetical protein